MKYFKKSESPTIQWVIAMIIIAVATLLMLLSVSPASIPDDGANILNDIFHHDRWRDWHPITYYLFLRLCMWRYESPRAVIFVQALMFLAAQYQVVRYLDRYGRRWISVIYALLTLTLGLSGYEYIIIFYKDSPYSIAVLGVVVSILYCIREKGSILRIVQLTVWGIIAAMMRHAGWLPLVTGIAILAVVMLVKGWKDLGAKLIISCVTMLVVFFCVRGAFLHRYEPEVVSPGYVTYTMPIYMLGAYSTADYELDDSIVAMMEKVAPLEVWQEAYVTDPYWADNVSRTWGVMGDRIERVDSLGLHGDIMKANVVYFTSHPVDYIRKLFKMNNLVWRINTPDDGYVWIMGTYSSGQELIRQFPEWEARTTAIGEYTGRFLNMAKTNALWKCAAYRGGIALLLIVITMVCVFINKRRYEALSFLPVILLQGMMLLSIPAQDPRYILPAVMVSCLGVCII